MTQSTNTAFYDRISAELADIDAQGLTKPERVIASRQGPVISVNGRDVLNFCANNYLGLAGDERVTQAGIKAMEKWGAGTASVRFICGTLEIHKELERAIAGYLGFEDAILFAAAF
ncbi:MAG TPA: aminotransferase class I/II-fold pyridoxal phosphate-dependent enzyme, partial [Brevundimonas sp.]|nr:aminotransferase class I/II-fold pyridoxal phosphate-dependent enzyme [Brevundimonas sp.]